MAIFMDGWRKHAIYWLTKYTGSIKVIRYKDLGLETFQEIISYFGVDTDLNER